MFRLSSILTFFLLKSILATSLWAQDLLNSRSSSYHTYLFQLKEAEASNLYSEGMEAMDESYLHSLLDSFPTDSGLQHSLARGHYLFAHTKHNQLVLELYSVGQLQFQVIDNQRDLILLVHDSLGTIIPNAEVWVGKKSIPFDPSLQAYRLPKVLTKGLVQLKYQGFTDYYQLHAKNGPPSFKRVLGRIVYTIPIRWLWRPPVQFVKGFVGSIWRRYPYGWADRLISKIQYSIWNEGFQGTSYFITNKPIYRPGDTVRMKAFVMNKKGRKLRRGLNLYLQGSFGHQNSTRHLVKLTPYRPGAYDYAFVLHDSLDLQLDQAYRLQLDSWFDYPMIETSFKFEEYELNQARFSANRSKESHQRGEQQKLTLRVSDANQHNLPGSEAHIFILPERVEDWGQNHLFLPDTLWQHEQGLDPIGETSIMVPDSIFPSAHFRYSIQVELFTAEREKETFEFTATFDAQEESLNLSFVADSLKADYFFRKQSRPATAILEALNQHRKILFRDTVELPATRQVNPIVATYRLRSGELSTTARGPGLVQVQSVRGLDSLHILVQNPRKLPLWYHLYHQNEELVRGNADSLDVHIKSLDQKPYFLSLSYLWEGDMQSEEYKIPSPNKETLTLELTHPPRIFPGQEVDISIEAVNGHGQAVEDLDVAAFGISNQFKERNVPQLSPITKASKDRAFFNQFWPAMRKQFTQSEDLEYIKWNQVHRLDSISMYQFLYPRSGIYRFTLNVPDSITQLSPYVVNEKGELDPVIIIYVDHIPVFFREAKGWERYSIPVDSGYHTVDLRTHHRSIRLDSLYIPHGKKLILSASTHFSHPQKQVIGMPDKLSNKELAYLKRFFIPLKPRYLPSFAYLKQDNRIYWNGGRGKSSRYWDSFFGPFVPDTFAYHAPGNFQIKVEYEPHHQYEFKKQWVKLSPLPFNFSVSPFGLFPDQDFFSEQLQFGTFAYTETEILNAWEESVFQNKIADIAYDMPKWTDSGFGTLHTELPDTVDLPKALILLQTDSVANMRNVPPGTREFHQLAPGSYSLLMFTSSSSYFKFDSLQIKANGINHYFLSPDSVRQVDSLMRMLFDLSTSRLLDSVEQGKNKLEMKRALSRKYASYEGSDGKVLRGTIRDANGNPLIGATVLIRGTTTGTLTGSNGDFEIQMPSDGQVVVSYVGFASQDIDASGLSFVEVPLSSDLTLEEVSVTGYGAHSGIDSRTVEGKMPGLSGQTSGVYAEPNTEGKVVRIRGIGSRRAGTPFYLIDGVPFTGNLEDLDLDKNDLRHVQIIRDSSVTGIYGSRAASGVILIETRSGAGSQIPSPIAEDNAAPFPLPIEASSLRQNFRDDAFWKPRLRTDEKGKANFQVTFPDDITQWKLYALAMGKGKYIGQTSSLIQAYKPMQARLSLPSFLIEGDHSQVIGKVQNFLGETVQLTQEFVLGTDQPIQNDLLLSSSQLDTLSLLAPSTDSLDITFRIQTENGYEDGEKRSIPIFLKGSKVNIGHFLTLEGDTSLELSFDPDKGPIRLYAERNQLGLVRSEIRQLQGYPHSCNEQAASKLKALLWEQQIAEQFNEPFTKKRLVQRLIRKLLKAQRSDQYWGWWPEGKGKVWITSHVIDALLMAKKQEYYLDVRSWELQKSLAYDIQEPAQWSHLAALDLLYRIESPANRTTVKAILSALETDSLQSIQQTLDLVLIKQQYQLPYTLDSLWTHLQVSSRQNWFWRGQDNSHLHHNELLTTLKAYQILRAANVGTDTLKRVRQYLFEHRANSGQWNTYQAARILAEVLPDILQDSSQTIPAELMLNDVKIRNFSQDTSLTSTSHISIDKSGLEPVYLSLSQSYHDPSPEVKESEMQIHSWIGTLSDTLHRIRAGHSTALHVRLDLKKDADHLMLEIPIPAGCSYDSKKQSREAGEIHREYKKQQVSIFCEKLTAGTYHYHIQLLPRYVGSYTINPPRAENMYFPIFEGRGQMNKLIIEP